MPNTHQLVALKAHFIPTLTIIGVGLIGGSFAAALRHQGLVGRVLGVGRSATTMQKALDLGLVDQVLPLEEAVAQADVILVATPVQSMERIFAQMMPHVSPKTIVMDAGSTKKNIIAAAKYQLGSKIGQFIPCHPIAGSNMDGPEAAQATLFEQRRVILCPLPENQAGDLAHVHAWWQACGANTLTLEPDRHDAIYAKVSHLPHLIAFGFMDALLKDQNVAETLRHAGTGFKDFTRIAASSPELWRDVFLANSQPVLEALATTIQSLNELQIAIQTQDIETLDRLLTGAAAARHQWNLTF